MERKEDIQKLVQETALFSNTTLTLEQIESVFLSLTSIIEDNYSKNQKTYIPYIGDIAITYIKDKTVKQGIRGELKISITPDSFLEHEICVLEKDYENDDKLYITSRTLSHIKKTLEST